MAEGVAAAPATAMWNVTGAAKIEGFALAVTVTVTALVGVDCACREHSAAERIKTATEAKDLGLR
jgi:hypothetical protein